VWASSSDGIVVLCTALSLERPAIRSLMLLSVKEVSPMTALRKRMLEDLRIRNYAPSTVECYVRSVAEFARHFNKSPDQLGPEQIRSWQLFLLNEKQVKLSTYIQAVCGLRFFYRNTLNRSIDIERIPLPRYEKKLHSFSAGKRSKRC
jgi:site-specific recombinase XerD